MRIMVIEVRGTKQALDMTRVTISQIKQLEVEFNIVEYREATAADKVIAL